MKLDVGTTIFNGQNYGEHLSRDKLPVFLWDVLFLIKIGKSSEVVSGLVLIKLLLIFLLFIAVPTSWSAM